MNEPMNSDEVHDDRIERLKALKPRLPKLDWDAIHSARISVDSDRTREANSRSTRIPPSVAWWSGLAAGVVITYFAMQWLVLNELKSELQQLKQTVRQTPFQSTEIQSAQERVASSSRSIVDIRSAPDPTRLSVGSYRMRGDRWIHALSNSDAPQSTDEGFHTSSPLEVEPTEPVANRLLLIRELKQIVH